MDLALSLYINGPLRSMGIGTNGNEHLANPTGMGINHKNWNGKDWELSPWEWDCHNPFPVTSTSLGDTSFEIHILSCGVFGVCRGQL